MIKTYLVYCNSSGIYLETCNLNLELKFQAAGIYHTMAYASKTALGTGVKARSWKMEKKDNDNIKLTISSQL